MDQVYIHNKTTRDIIALWDSKEHVIPAGGFLPVERGIAKLWMKHYGKSKDKKNPEFYLEIKELGDMTLASTPQEVQVEEVEEVVEEKPAPRRGRPKKSE